MGSRGREREREGEGGRERGREREREGGRERGREGKLERRLSQEDTEQIDRGEQMRRKDEAERYACTKYDCGNVWELRLNGGYNKTSRQYHLFTRLREVLVVEHQMTILNYCKESVRKFTISVTTEHSTLLSEVVFQFLTLKAVLHDGRRHIKREKQKEQFLNIIEAEGTSE